MTNPAPSITVTRDDVLALPLRCAASKFRPLEPRGGHVWSLHRMTVDAVHAWQVDRLTWVEHPEGEPTSGINARYLSAEESEVAERTVQWQNILACSAAFDDIAADEAPPQRHKMLCIDGHAVKVAAA